MSQCLQWSACLSALVVVCLPLAGSAQEREGAVVLPFLTDRPGVQAFSPHPGGIGLFAAGSTTGVYAPIGADGRFTLPAPGGPVSLVAGFDKMETVTLVVPDWQASPSGISGWDMNATGHYDYVCVPPGYPDTWDSQYKMRSHNFYQTFVAKSRWLYRVTLFDGPKIVYWGNKVSVHIHEDGIDGPPILMRFHDATKSDQTALHTDYAFPSVGFRHGDVELVPGRKYAVRVHGYESHGGEYFDVDLFVRPDNGDGYGPGRAYAERVAQEGDLCMFIMGNATGQLVENQMRTPEWEILIPRRPPTTRWGQTFANHGKSMAAVQFWASNGSLNPVSCEVRIRENGPDGQQVGPTKVAVARNSPELPIIRYPDIPGQLPGYASYYEPPFDEFSVAFVPDECPLVPGQTYYVELTPSEPIMMFADGDYYHDGYAYYNLQRIESEQIFHSPRWTLLTSIVTYENPGGLPTEYTVPTPTPGPGDNLLLNPGAEEGDYSWWTIGGDPVIDPSTHIPDPANHSGQHRFGMSVGWGTADFYQYQQVAVVADATYEAGMWAVKEDGTDETLELTWIDGPFGGTEQRLYYAGPTERLPNWTGFAGQTLVPTQGIVTLVVRYRHLLATEIASIHVDDIYLNGPRPAAPTPTPMERSALYMH